MYTGHVAHNLIVFSLFSFCCVVEKKGNYKTDIGNYLNIKTIITLLNTLSRHDIILQY